MQKNFLPSSLGRNPDKVSINQLPLYLSIYIFWVQHPGETEVRDVCQLEVGQGLQEGGAVEQVLLVGDLPHTQPQANHLEGGRL